MSDKPFLANARCSIQCNMTHHEETYHEVKRTFKRIVEGVKPKEKSRIMVMKDRGELWDWGLNERVSIPDSNSSCLEISEFIEFIKTRKW